MRLWILSVLALLWACAAQAQWVATSEPETGQHTASACTTSGDDTLCFALSCTGEEALSFTLMSETIPDMIAAPSVEAMVFVGSRMVGALDFTSDGLGVFRAPLERSHVDGLERLKAGMRAELRLWFAPDTAPEIYRIGLRGSRKAISAVEAQCPLPDFQAREVERRTTADPGAVVLGELAEACTALDGTLTVQEGFVRELELNGVRGFDLIINHSLAECSTAAGLVCGASGCLHSVWLKQPDDRYRRIFLDSIASYSPVEPGVIEMTFQGRGCRGGGCLKRFLVNADGLEEFN